MSDRPTDPAREGRGQGQTPPQTSADARLATNLSGPTEGLAGEPAEEATSRTLFSFLEPSLNTIGSFGTPLVVAGIVGLVVGIVLMAFVGSMRLYGGIIIGIGVALIGLVALIYLSSVFAAFISRTGRYGINTLIMLTAFVGIIVVLNFILFSNNIRVDVTATNQFSLNRSTKNLLNDLDQPVRATAFFQEDLAGQQPDQFLRRAKVEDTLSEFGNRSRNFTFRFLDPDLEREIAIDLGVTQYESIAIEGIDSGIVDIVQSTDQSYSQLEQDLYTSILVATQQGQRQVYFLSGHGERNINSSLNDGYRQIRTALEADNYQVDTLQWNPAEDKVIVPDGETYLDGSKCPEDAENCRPYPANADLLVIAGPGGDLPQAHADALNQYLLGLKSDGADRLEGARVIFLAEPDTKDSFREFLASWGVLVDAGYIRDLNGSQPGSPRTLRVGRYHPVALPEILNPRGTPLGVSLMPGTASLRSIDDGARLPTPLAFTSRESYIIEDIDRTEPITNGGEQVDIKGAFVPAVHVQAIGPVGTALPPSPPPDNRVASLVVFGDSDFLTDNFVNRGSGANLFLNTANYLLGDISLISIRDRQFVFREWNLDKNELNFVQFSSWFFIPGLMGLMAALVWWVRR